MGDGGWCAEKPHDPAPFGAMGVQSPAAVEQRDRIVRDLVGDRCGQTFREVAHEQIGIEPELVAVPAAAPGTSILSSGGPRQIETDARHRQFDPFVPRDKLQAPGNLVDHP